jgi:zinc/manganese transport system substrate-binding protein
VVNSISTGSEDPHFIQAKPSYMVMARDADLWIRVGMDLEIGWEVPILQRRQEHEHTGRRARHLDASERVLKRDIPSGKVTRDMGDVHPQGNPHYWLDPLNARIVAKSIADRLSKLEPAYAEDFQRNLASFREALDGRMFGKKPVEAFGGARLWSLLLKGKLDRFLEDEGLELKGWLGRMKPFRGQKIVTYHRSWTYFTDRFGLVIIGELEPKPGIPPSPSHLEAIIELVKKDHAKVDSPGALLQPEIS